MATSRKQADPGGAYCPTCGADLEGVDEHDCGGSVAQAASPPRSVERDNGVPRQVAAFGPAVQKGVTPQTCECGKRFLTAGSLAAHREISHAEPAAPADPEYLACQACGLLLDSEKELAAHAVAEHSEDSAPRPEPEPEQEPEPEPAESRWQPLADQLHAMVTAAGILLGEIERQMALEAAGR